MTPNDAATLVTALGGLSGLATLIAAIGAWHNARKSRDNTQELKPDHGNTMADKQEVLISLVKSLGHQIGEIRSDMNQNQANARDIHQRLWDAIKDRDD